MHILSKLILSLCCSTIIFSIGDFATASTQQTSITDESSYRHFCREAAEDEALFANFKRHPILITVLQHLSYEQGLLFMKAIEQNYPHLITQFDEYQANDFIGNPIAHEYPPYGTFSATNLRYIKIAGDIETLFQDRSIQSIVEIGGGYGGQCTVLSALLSPQKFTLIDLPETLALAKKHCQILGLGHVNFVTMEQIDPSISYDLVISNYAFSECSLDVQKLYLDKVIKNSKAGYMICNIIPYFETEQPLGKEEITSILRGYGFQVDILPEFPLTGGHNYLLVWRR